MAYSPRPKNMTQLLQDLTIFGEQVNQRPEIELYYSEKLINKQEYDNYKKAIRKFEEIIKRWERKNSTPKT